MKQFDDERETVLVAEDDPISAKIITETLQQGGYGVIWAKNGEEAIHHFRKTPCRVVITDIQMPHMDGQQLINALGAERQPPLFIVQTIEQDPSRIISIMKSGVYDYILKPVISEDILFKVRKALDHVNLSRAAENAERDKILRLEQHLEWYRWRERHQHGDDQLLDKKTLFRSMMSSFNQGAGIGAMVVLFNLLNDVAEDDGEYKRIPQDLFASFRDNAVLAEKALMTFERIASLMGGEIVREKHVLGDLYALLVDTVGKMTELAPLGGHKIVVSEMNDHDRDVVLDFSNDDMSEVFHELLVNACKFSRRQSTIHVVVQRRSEKVRISFFSDPRKDESGREGIPQEYSNIVFEPFSRLFRSVYEQYRTLDYGLGLTLVEKIIQAHGGKVEIGNINDYSNLKTGPSIRVCVSITL